MVRTLPSSCWKKVIRSMARIVAPVPSIIGGSKNWVYRHPQLHLVEYDLTDLGSSIALVQKTRPQEIYNLAAQSFVGVSFDQPTTTAQITG